MPRHLLSAEKQTWLRVLSVQKTPSLDECRKTSSPGILALISTKIAGWRKFDVAKR
jgi:hypothetical protein